MKKNLIYFGLLFTLITLSSCEKNDAPPDPAGTITTSINYTDDPTPIILYFGLAGDGPYSINGSVYPYVKILVGMKASLNFVFHTSVVQNNSGATNNPIWFGLGSFGGEVANMGKVDGLGSITTKPSSGWSTTAAVEIGSGYVIRYKASRDHTTNALPYKYARFYVVDWVKSSLTDGVIGAKMKYETSF